MFFVQSAVKAYAVPEDSTGSLNQTISQICNAKGIVSLACVIRIIKTMY